MNMNVQFVSSFQLMGSGLKMSQQLMMPKEYDCEYFVALREISSDEKCLCVILTIFSPFLSCAVNNHI